MIYSFRSKKGDEALFRHMAMANEVEHLIVIQNQEILIQKFHQKIKKSRFISLTFSC